MFSVALVFAFTRTAIIIAVFCGARKRTEYLFAASLITIFLAIFLSRPLHFFNLHQYRTAAILTLGQVQAYHSSVYP